MSFIEVYIYIHIVVRWLVDYREILILFTRSETVRKKRHYYGRECR
jgi:hypothetical protein